MIHVKLTNLKIHTVGWLLYSIVCYLINLLSNSGASYMGLLAALPLPVLVFYWGYIWARWLDSGIPHWLAGMVVLMAAVPFIGLCYLIVYVLLPSIGIYIPYTLDVTWQQLVRGLLPDYLRFTAYGVIYCHLEKSVFYRRMRGRLLAMQLTPHSLHNMCTRIAETVISDQQRAIRYLQGYMGMIRYAVHVPELSEDLVPVDHELAKLESWVDTCGEKIFLEVEGDRSQCVLPPFALITLVENALKYRMPATSVDLYICCKDRHLVVRCVNTPDVDGSPSEGLGLGLKNLAERVDLLRGDGMKISLYTGLRNGSYVAQLELTNRKI